MLCVRSYAAALVGLHSSELVAPEGWAVARSVALLLLALLPEVGPGLGLRGALSSIARSAILSVFHLPRLRPPCIKMHIRGVRVFSG